ncbi:protein of unknown function [Limnospira indica PCC 8005]|uniref:Uncharacterized protein n=1 Tax=Limnospira indica PCC 8005 TaxID=376219 RepID=A0A9P1KIW4_9CYAN|nr:protein of unknown function [Limnospira indica PCC 8005]
MFTSGAVCWETRMHGFELELGKVTSLSTITVPRWIGQV